MYTADVARLVDFLYWMRDEVLAQAAQLAPEQLASGNPGTARDLWATLVHELDVEWSWRARLQGLPPDKWGPEAELRPADFPTVEALRVRWQTDETEMRAWIASLGPDELAAPAPHEGTDARPLESYILHVVMHATHQFTDAAVVLTQLGRSPGDLDFLDFVDARGEPPPG